MAAAVQGWAIFKFQHSSKPSTLQAKLKSLPLKMLADKTQTLFIFLWLHLVDIENDHHN
jgi:hypothetical protein